MRRVHKSYNMLALEIHAGVASGDAEIVSDLLKAGASVDKRDDFGNTPLHRAAWQGDRQIVQTLLRHGAGAAVQRPDGATPLDLAKLRAGGGGDRPPQGLSVEARGDIQGVLHLLLGRRSRIDTEDETLAVTEEPLQKSASFSVEPIRKIASFSEMCFLALNELTTSTCASESDFLQEDHMEVLAQTFECMAANIPS
jgi:hypothetical protein